MVRTQIQLTEQQAALIRQAAGAKHISMAETIREAIDLLLQQEFQPTRADRIQRALQAAGRFRSGHTNTSVAHDKALAEAYRT